MRAIIGYDGGNTEGFVMATKLKLVPLRGPVHWVETSKAVLGQITGATLQNNDRLVFNLNFGGTYSVRMEREFGDRFVGEWSFIERGETVTGRVEGTLYASATGYFIFGRWSEEGEHHWWAELVIIEDE